MPLPNVFAETCLPGWRRLVLTLAILGFPITLISLDRLWSLHPVTASGQALPYGFDVLPDHFTVVQDFTYNMNFFRQIWEHRVQHPYRLEDQKTMVENWVSPPPFILSHAYSPVALVLSLPFVFLPSRLAYLLYCALSYLGLLALLRGYLLPRAQNFVQVLVLVPCLLGYSLATSYSMGQTSLFTTGFFALIWVFWEKRAQSPRWEYDLVLGLLTWAICAKPSVALIALSFLLGCRLWHALFFCGGLLALTWICLADRYGGLISGLRDYSFLLGHYCRSEMPLFLRSGFTVLSNTSIQAFLISLDPALDKTSFAFDLGRRLNLAGYALLIAAMWFRWITSENFFRGLLWVFVLFCPYLLATEDWVLCLFLVGNPFFRPSHGMGLKSLLVAGIANARAGIISFWPIYLPLKLALCLWWLIDAYFLKPKETRVPAPTV